MENVISVKNYYEVENGVYDYLFFNYIHVITAI
jgi:hypothetical protein